MKPLSLENITSDDDRKPFIKPDPGEETSDDTKQPQAPTTKRRQLLSLSNLPFIYFVTSAALSILCALFYIMENSIGFIAAGVIGLIICTYGIKHFKTLMNIKIEVDKYVKLNKKFETENKHLKQTVDTLSKANDTLSDTRDRLHISNLRNRENLQVFRGIQFNMKQFNAQSMDEVRDILEKSNKIEKQWHNELYKHERLLLYTVFDRFCSYQSHIGMTEEEFEMFTKELPQSYQNRFARMGTFSKLAGDGNIILLEDFVHTLDIFAEMETTDVDIEFELKPTKTKRKLSPRKSLAQRKRTFSEVQSTSPKKPKRHARKMSFIDSITSEISKDSSDYEIEDDRKYDSELLKYQSQIVITKRSAPRPNLEQQRDSVYNSFKLPHLTSSLRQGSTMPLWLQNVPPMTPMTPNLAPLMPFSKPSNPYFKANTFRTNKRVTDLSMLNIDEHAMTPFRSPRANPFDIPSDMFLSPTPRQTPPIQTPRLDKMTTDDIQSREFSNEEIDKYMDKMKNKGSNQ